MFFCLFPMSQSGPYIVICTKRKGAGKDERLDMHNHRRRLCRATSVQTNTGNDTGRGERTADSVCSDRQAARSLAQVAAKPTA